MRSPSSCTKSVFACQVRRPRRAGQALAYDAPSHIAFRYPHSVGARDETTFAAQCLAYNLPCRRFAGALARAHARLGADVVCYSFTVVDLHHLLLASLLALAGHRPMRHGPATDGPEILEHVTMFLKMAIDRVPICKLIAPQEMNSRADNCPSRRRNLTRIPSRDAWRSEGAETIWSGRLIGPHRVVQVDC